MRRYVYHVYTPMGRPQNIQLMLEMLRSKQVIWHPLFDPDKFQSFAEHWIQPLPCSQGPEDWLQNNWVCNCFVRDWPILDSGGRYINLNDDDFVEPEFFDKVDVVEGEVLVVGMKRGDHQPAEGLQYGNSTLEANAAHLKLGFIGGEQIVCSGHTLSRHRFGRRGDGDWSFISSITACHPPVFVPDAWVWFNYLEPGRWDK